MFICFYVIWDGNSGDGDLVVQWSSASSEDDARAAFAANESCATANIAVLSARDVTRNAAALRKRTGPLRKFFTCLWMAEPTGHGGECWAFVFETATADDASRNLYLYRFSQDNETASEVQAEFELNGFRFCLSEINAHSLTEIVEEHIEVGTDGYQQFMVNHCIIPIDDLERCGQVRINRRGSAKDRQNRRRDQIRPLMEELSKKDRREEER